MQRFGKPKRGPQRGILFYVMWSRFVVDTAYHQCFNHNNEPYWRLNDLRQFSKYCLSLMTTNMDSNIPPWGFATWLWLHDVSTFHQGSCCTDQNGDCIFPSCCDFRFMLRHLWRSILHGGSLQPGHAGCLDQKVEECCSVNRNFAERYLPWYNHGLLTIKALSRRSQKDHYLKATQGRLREQFKEVWH